MYNSLSRNKNAGRTVHLAIAFVAIFGTRRVTPFHGASPLQRQRRSIKPLLESSKESSENTSSETITTTEQIQFDQIEQLSNIREDVLERTKKTNLLSSIPPVVKDETKRQITTPKLILLALGTYASSLIMADLLVQLEWFQAWRYFWPLVGGVYVVDALQLGGSTRSFTNGKYEKERQQQLWLPLSPNSFLNESVLGRGVSAVAGVGLIVGGAYDAFMPVWYTGPNVFTEAGIGQDSAAILFIMTLLAIVQDEIIVPKNDDRELPLYYPEQDDNTREWPFGDMLLQTLLLSELYKLSESSFDAIISNLVG